MNDVGALNPAPRARRVLVLLRALSWCVVAYAGLQLGLGSIGALAVPPKLVLWLFGAVEVAIVGGLAVLLVIAEPREPASRSATGLSVLQQVAVGSVLGVLLKVPADALRATIDVYWPTPQAQLQAQAELLRHDTWVEVMCLILVVGIVGPIVEEAFYRGAVFNSFRRTLGRVGAVVLSSVVFALSHASPRDWLPLTLVAIGIGTVRVQTSALWAGIAAHVAFNLGALVLLFLGREVDITRTPWWGAAALVSFALLMLLLWRLGQRMRQGAAAG